MIYTIFNEKLSVSVDSMGAQLRSVRGADGTEYLWQGDALYWADSSPVLFPYIARLYKNSYTYRGEAFNMSIHGFYGFDYFGIWHAPGTEAPYLCLEPWSSLPSRQGVVEELTEKKDMLMLSAGEEFENKWLLSIREGK